MRGQMKEMLLGYGATTGNVNAIMMRYKNTQMRSLNGDTDFEMTDGVLHSDTLASLL